MNLIFRYLYFFLPLLSESISTNPIKPKLCVNCRYFTKDFFTPSRFGKCILFPREDYSSSDYLVNGRKQNTKLDYYHCSTARHLEHMCGEEGKLYEKK